MQIATIVGERGIKIVPDISAGGAGGGLAEALIARMLGGRRGRRLPRRVPGTAARRG
jgi:hypothetical protein